MHTISILHLSAQRRKAHDLEPSAHLRDLEIAVEHEYRREKAHEPFAE